MSEWSKEPDSKSGVVLCITEGSNPSLSEEITSRNKPLERCPSGRRCTIGSRVWSKAIGGSNPPLSVQQQIPGYEHRPTPSGQECSSGKRKVHETGTICCCFFHIMPMLNHFILRFIFLCIGLGIMGFGVEFSILASLGTSPISSVPYVTGEISGLSVGTTTIILNTLFLLLQIILLKKDFRIFQLLQLAATIVFGFMIDAAEYCIGSAIAPESYPEQLLLCLGGIVLVALGISFEVMAGLVTVPGEGIVLAISRITGVKFGNVKVCFDASLVVIAIILSLIFLHRIDGIREGTILAALLVGQVTKITNRLTARIGRSLFS